MKASTLAGIRKKIDALDRRVAGLLARRFALALVITRKGLKKKFTDPARERRVLGNAAAAAGCPEFGRAARAVFTEVIRQTKKIQKC
ncbi:MAG: chorismate mutase [Elusimicrobiota bacterium]